MRFSDKGYYIEGYIKCANCGVLVYDTVAGDDKSTVFCSEWCREWSAARNAGNSHPVLPLPR